MEHYKGMAWELVRVIQTEVAKTFAPVLQAVGLPEHQAIILMAIGEGDSNTISKLAERLNANQGNFSATCKKMEQMGLIDRKRSREDERVVKIELTPFGEEKLNDIIGRLNDMFHKAETSPEQLETIIAGCSEAIKLLHAINKSKNF